MSEYQRQEIRELLESVADDPALLQERVAACRAVANGLTAAGRLLWVGSYVLRDKRAEGVAILTQMAGELASGAVELLERELWYAAAALVRQLIEVEYLFGLFAHEDGSAAAWVASTPAEIRKWFAPGSLRARSAGEFRDSEYWNHCDIGGHPNPRGRLLLRDHASPVGSQAWLWIDLVQHLSRLWPSFRRSLVRYGLHDHLNAYLDEPERALDSWYQRENPGVLAIRVPE